MGGLCDDSLKKQKGGPYLWGESRGEFPGRVRCSLTGEKKGWIDEDGTQTFSQAPLSKRALNLV